MTSQDATAGREHADVVSKVTCPYKGAAFALQTRAKQLYDTVYALKQHIHTLREASNVSIKGHKTARTHLELPSSLLAEIPKDLELPENALLADEGLLTVIHQLANYDDKTAECIEKLYDPEKAFLGSIQLLNKELAEINLLLHRDRLGKAHQQHEDKVCSTASQLNQIILNLASALANPRTPTPYCDPFTVQRNVTYRMKEYLNKEKEYAIQCLTEQNVEKILEKNVFTIMQGIPLEHERIMCPTIDECNEILGAVEEKTKSFHALTDWTAFESRFADEFAPEETTPILITNENHPDEEQYSQFQRLRLDDLEIYHKIRPKKMRNPNFEAKLRRAKEMLTPSRRDYGCRGTWSVSSAGHLIEYDMKEHTLISMFDLRKCKLGDLAPDETGTLGYFILRGQKARESSDKKHHKKRDYKFRAPVEKAKELYDVLSEYCKVAQVEDHVKENQQEEGEELTRALSGDTAVSIDAQPRVE